MLVSCRSSSIVSRSRELELNDRLILAVASDGLKRSEEDRGRPVACGGGL